MASKRIKKIKSAVDSNKVYSANDAIALLKKTAVDFPVKFNQSFEAAVSLGVDAKKSDQNVRGATTLPNGTGKTVKVAVFTRTKVEDAKNAGADYVGLEDLAEDLKTNKISMDNLVIVAHPEAMGIVGSLGSLLGPKGLMPNPKTGTVTPDVAKAVHNAKSGQVRYRNDKNGIIHCLLGKVDFTEEAIKQNLEVLMHDLRKLKPVTSKGVYFKKVTISTTMGPGLSVDLSSLSF